LDRSLDREYRSLAVKIPAIIIAANMIPIVRGGKGKEDCSDDVIALRSGVEVGVRVGLRITNEVTVGVVV